MVNVRRSVRWKSVLRNVILFGLIFTVNAGNDVVFEPAFLVASAPEASAFLVGNISSVSLSLSRVLPSNVTGRLPAPSCVQSDPGQWVLSQEPKGNNALQVQLSLNRSLQLCGNRNESDCCLRPLCVRETVRVCACRADLPQACLTVQVQIYAQLHPAGPVAANKIAIPNQTFQPLGRCPCNLTPNVCDIRCCCDADCTPQLLELFAGQCLPGPFGGTVSLVPDYVCSAQAADNAPDWFPFLCVTSPSENNPFLGLFYQGNTITTEPAPSFKMQQASAPVPAANYRQGEPIFTTNNQYLTIPQVSVLGPCLENAPVAFLQDFEAVCVRTLWSCPAASSELRVNVSDGQGGVVTVSVVDEVTTQIGSFLSDSAQGTVTRSCVNVVLALSYTFSWRANSVTAITVTRLIGNITLHPGASLSTRYSVRFVNGNITSQSNSGNPGYQVGRPVIGGLVDSLTGNVDKVSVSLWKTGGDGLCASADQRPVLYGMNSTSGCLMSVTLRDLRQCAQLRETVRSALTGLVPATLVSSSGKPDFSTLAGWTHITTVVQNASQTAEGARGLCSGVPAHLHIHIRSGTMGGIGGVPQKMIQAVELSFKESTWRLECEAVEENPCLNPDLTQSFPVTSSVTFTDALSTPTPVSRFRINITEFDCERNDVCLAELAYPFMPYYTGEPFSQSLAKGLILVFLVIAVSLLGTPCQRIRRAWSDGLL